MTYASISEAYGKNFNGKKKKKSKKVSACHYYAQRYSDNGTKKEQLDVGGLDNSDGLYSKYDKNSAIVSDDLYAERQDFIKVNKDKLNNCDIKEEQDYFDKLYEHHDFRPQMSTDGDNIMTTEPTKYDEVEYDNSINREIKSASNMDLKYKRMREFNNDVDDITNREDDTESIGTSMVANRGSERGTKTEPVAPVTRVKNGEIKVENVNNVNKKYENDKNYMDLGLYLISGILLIFILEQFVQIGVMMRETRGSVKVGGNSGYSYPPAPPQMHPMYYQNAYPHYYPPPGSHTGGYPGGYGMPSPASVGSASVEDI